MLPLKSLPPYISSYVAFFQEKVFSFEKFLGNAGDTFLVIAKLKDKSAELQKEKLFWKTTTQLISSLEEDNNYLRKILRFQYRTPYTLIPAEIIARSPENWFSYFTLNQGKKTGVKLNQAVINEEGLVGKIIEVGDNYSKVLTITAPQSRVSIVAVNSGDLGLAQGYLHHPLKLNYIANNAEINPEDIIKTSGISNFFPKGIMVGKVIKVKKDKYQIFQKVDVEPAVNFSKL
ncbi:MAG: rod shape-determining protein MreC, partial [Candidatus Margulisbacteria bacterium]|nr:rod shape-determining protein MreC [Candidatus Margulisiibacteriota bacterium]